MEQWLKQLVPKHDPWAQVQLHFLDVVCILLHLPAFKRDVTEVHS